MNANEWEWGLGRELAAFEGGAVIQPASVTHDAG
jgi:hypothetical protein